MAFSLTGEGNRVVLFSCLGDFLSALLPADDGQLGDFLHTLVPKPASLAPSPPPPSSSSSSWPDLESLLQLGGFGEVIELLPSVSSSVKWGDESSLFLKKLLDRITVKGLT